MVEPSGRGVSPVIRNPSGTGVSPVIRPPPGKPPKRQSDECRLPDRLVNNLGITVITGVFLAFDLRNLD